MANIVLYNNDCLIKLKDITDESVDCIITDPPYYVLPNGKSNDNFDWDKFESFEQFLDFTKKWLELCYYKLKNDSFMYVFWSQKYLNVGIDLFTPDRLLLWEHDNLVFINSGDFTYEYEPIFVIKKGNPKLSKGKHLSILKYTKPQSNFKNDVLLHPTQKPLMLIEELVKISTQENQTILDCFMGSGTVGVACESLNRNFIGIEKNKNYFDIAEKRINESKENIFNV